MTATSQALPAAEPAAERIAHMIARGVCRMLGELGHGTLTEFSLPNGRRADVIGLDRDGRFVIVEVKSCAADFLSDGKWEDYLEYCDRYYFAVAPDFPQELLPAGHGLIVADSFDAVILREAAEAPMHAARRKAQLLRFALTASGRLTGLVDPRI
ncbi:MAG TPA: MmcB family DNA repair protein [Alphaproteobacteria bacterium]|jgi:hypothetical protein|nr:MmcB family DNA repair protein [Alphaproteobacteria bacterium]